MTTMTSGPAPALHEIIIEMNLRERGHCYFYGNRAMLEDEGLIPDFIEWPTAFEYAWWEDDKFHYWLRRERPDGAKGPRKQYLDCDWWSLRRNPGAEKSYFQREILEKAKELKDLIYQNSAIGRAQSQKDSERLVIVFKDAKFQAFKLLIPALVPPVRKRAAR